MFKRTLSPAANHSYFLFGPRQTGKSSFVRDRLGPSDLYIDLLPQRIFLNYAKAPGQFREEILAYAQKRKRFSCVIDEIQKLPALLDEVHSLIESHQITFILTGSSARKLKQRGSNLLAGRAYTYRLYPLTFDELGSNFNLERALNFGTLPALWGETANEPSEFLKSYAETYLREEIREEGLVRDIAPFSKFLDLLAAQDGELVNYSSFSRECGVSVKTVQQYHQILEDTFIALCLRPWTISTRHRMVSHPRSYFFDPGITNALTHRLSGQLDPVSRGRRFEQFVILQIRSALEYLRKDIELFFWRTHSGLEVDLLLTKGNSIQAAVEIKSSPQFSSADVKGLLAFGDLFPRIPRFILSTIERERMTQAGTVMSWKNFIQDRLPLL